MLATISSPPEISLAHSSLFLDFDGTLVPIAQRPDAVILSTRTHALVRRIAAGMDGRLAVVSGRPAAQVRALLGGMRLTVAGSHGLEMMYADGSIDRPSRPDILPAAAEELEALSAQLPGTLVEEKPYGVAIHYREAPEAAEACEAAALELAARTGLKLQPGKMVFELRAPGADKGVAIHSLMRRPPMTGTTPWFLGDDLTDEVGFQAVGALGGGGILVGAPRATAARYRLEDVEAVLAWLERLAEQMP